jgi:type 1 glutamine amidotransferase
MSWSLGALIVLSGVLIAGFFYKIKNGFPVSFETEVPEIKFPGNRTAILLFSKTSGYRHESSIAAGKEAFAKMAKDNDWYLFETEEGGVFNSNQLSEFNIVIFNNSTGRVLNDGQQAALEKYVEQGGTLVGIHGSGDDSHQWNWYKRHLMGVEFSHHPLDPQLQPAEIMLNAVPDSLLLNDLAPRWNHTDEWYIFFNNPRKRGFNVLYHIDGEKIIPNGNFLFVTDKDFGMGKDHPVAWYKTTGKGRTFYTSIGHDRNAWRQPEFLKMLENVINWK